MFIYFYNNKTINKEAIRCYYMTKGGGKMSIGKNNKVKTSKILLFGKSKKGLIKMLFGRTGMVVGLLLLQILLLVSIFTFLERVIPYVVGTMAIFTVYMVVSVINAEHNTSVKLTWVILIMALPGFGGVLYIYIQREISHRGLRRWLKVIMSESGAEFKTQEELMEKLKIENKGLYNLATYTGRVGNFPVYTDSSVKYFRVGEEAFEEMLIQLSAAKEFIFLEYFIVAEGQMWGQVLKILSDKVKEGVEVRMMYDGTCEFALLPRSYPKRLRELGIQTKVFAPVRPFLSTYYNYRDHRKILVVDGRVAFTGGINLADEYINVEKVYGHWKDTAVMVAGEAVDSFTLMFLEMWNIDERKRNYIKDLYEAKPLEKPEKGYVLPFGDSPLDPDKVGEMVYMDILNRAEDYVHIMTPYLILDGEMVTALQFAAKRGIDVKIIMPHIPDKKFVFAQSRSHYKELMRAGVEIYEYTPGFIHAKSFVSDHIKAVVGTINLDYRSLYHHFECAVYMEEVPAVLDVEKDFNETLKKSQRVTLEDIKKYNVFMTIMGKVLKLIAPLL